MTVSSATSKVVHLGNGSSTVFPFAFKVFDAAHLQVIHTGADGVETVLDAGFTVSLNANQETTPGGSVGYTPAIASGTRLTVLRVVPYTQTTDIKNQGGYYPEVLERSLDLLTMQAQRLAEETGRAVKVDASSGDDPDDLLDDIHADVLAAQAAAIAAAGSEADAETARTAAEAAQAAAEAAQAAAEAATTYLPPGANAVAISFQDKLRQGFIVTPEDYGADGTAAGDTLGVRRALAAIQVAGGGTLHLSRFYEINDALVINNCPITIRGEGLNHSGLVDVGVTAATYMLNLVMDDYTDGILLHDFSLLTTKTTPDAYAMWAGFSEFDATYNRSPVRFVMRDIDIRGRDCDPINGFLTQGWAKGVGIVNCIRPLIERVNVCGKQTSFSAAGMTTLDVAWQFVQTGPVTVAPTDINMSLCQVYCANFAYHFDGAFQGVMVERCTAVGCNYGIFWDGNSGIDPWLSVGDSHLNCFREGITTFAGVFDLKIINNLIYKWDFQTSTGLVASTGIAATGAYRSTIIGNTFYNLCPGTNGFIQFDAITLTDTNLATVLDNSFEDVTYGLTLAGTSDNCVYRRGVWKPVASGGPSPVEYNNIGSGTNNRNEPAGECLMSGTYMPTLFNTTNVVGSAVATAHYIRVGEVVQVAALIALDPTTTAAFTELGIELPVASNVGAESDVIGSCAAPALNESGSIVGDAANNRALLQVVVGTNANHTVTVNFSYRVI